MNSENYKISPIKSWFIGNIITLCLFLTIYLRKFTPYQEEVYSNYLFYLAYIIIPFTGGFITKCINNEIPVYGYGSTWIIYYYYSISCSYCCEYCYAVTYVEYVKDISFPHIITYFTYVALVSFTASMIGGFIAILIRPSKNVHSDSHSDMRINLKYWIIINFFTANTGIAIIFILYLLDKIYCPPYYNFLSKWFYEVFTSITIILSLIIPFCGGFLIKLIKKDIPPCYYGTTGVVYMIIILAGKSYIHIVGLLFIICPGILSELKITFFLFIIMTSTLGGAIVEIYYKWKERKLSKFQSERI